jgi:restriction system protein
MADFTKRRAGELVRGVFTVLLNEPEGLAAADVLRRVEELAPATRFEDSTYEKSPSVRRYGKMVRFSTIGPVKAGWMVKNKGQWMLTDEGRAAYREFPDPEKFIRESDRLYREWRRAAPRDAPEEEGDPEDTDGEARSATFEEAEETAWTQIRSHLAEMPPYDFQDLVAVLLKAMGYHVLWVAPPGPDRGIDMIAHTDPLGTTSPRIKVQVKRTPESKISVHEIRSFMAVIGDQDVGIYIAAGGFTGDAEREARGQERRRLTLVDLNRLVELWIEHFSHIDDSDRQRLPLKPIYFLAPSG